MDKWFFGDSSKKADICLCLEGTYPYFQGGVANWAHDLILNQKNYTFHLLTILPPSLEAKIRYEIPPNVVSLTTVFLQKLKPGVSSIDNEEIFFKKLQESLSNIQGKASLEDISQIINLLKPYKNKAGAKLLLESQSAWQMIENMYLQTIPTSSFLDYFWSWRSLIGGLFSVLLSPIPNANLFHPLCTGYAGLFASRASLETKKPMILTEHGIYTNERKIEIISVDWLKDAYALNLNVDYQKASLRDFWINTFINYSRICYEASSKIITLFKGNQYFQMSDGADPKKLMIIPNGIDVEKYSVISKNSYKHSSTIALIGRVVPIKDIKTFLRASAILKQSIPDIKILVLGPTDEDPDYFEECTLMVSILNLEENVHFLGKVPIENYMPEIDIHVLTSLSEGQPLVMLETGAAGIPNIATNVGSCKEIIFGTSDEFPQLGEGGLVIPLSDPRSLAECILKLLSDQKLYDQSSQIIKERIAKYYDKKTQHDTYAKLYEEQIKVD